MSKEAHNFFMGDFQAYDMRILNAHNEKNNGHE